MKQWAITILIVIGGYSVFQWFTRQRQTAPGQRAAASFNLNLGPLGLAAGINSNVDPTAAGVPTFDQSAYANGRGDQVAAAYHTNPMATLPGSPTYSPAFGPAANQVTGNELPVGL